MGEGGGEEEKGRPDTKLFSKSCDTSKIWMWQWLDNTQYPLTSPTARAIGKEKPLKFFIDVLISCYRYVILLWTETQRGIQKGSRGRSQVPSWNKNKTRARVVFSTPRSLKDELGVLKSLLYQLLPKLCPSIGFTRPEQRREYQCFRYLSADLMLIWFFLDTDECSVSPSVCDTNANCSNTRGSYYCTCKAGFTGDGKNCQGGRKYFSW